MDDLISRKMVLALPRNKVRSLRTYEVVEETINVTDIEHLPPAQPDSKELSPTHKALDTISRKMAIDAIEEMQMPIMRSMFPEEQFVFKGMSEALSAIKDLPSAQPDMSEYSDKLWRNAYERGKAEAQQRWIPFKRRKPTEEEGTAFDYIMDCKCPEDGQNILVSINIQGHEPVQYDTFYGGGGEECCLESGCELVEEAIAWMPLPKPYRAERRTE